MKKEFKGKKSEGGGGGLLEEGDYLLKVHASEWKETKAGDGHYLKVEFVGADKKAGKRHFWHMFNFDNPNEEAVRISEEQFENLLYCLGVDDFKMPKKPNIEELHGMEVMAHITLEEATKKQKKKGFKDQNKISYFLESEDRDDDDKPEKSKKKDKKDKDEPDVDKKDKKKKNKKEPF